MQVLGQIKHKKRPVLMVTRLAQILFGRKWPKTEAIAQNSFLNGCNDPTSSSPNDVSASSFTICPAMSPFCQSGLRIVHSCTAATSARPCASVAMDMDVVISSLTLTVSLITQFTNFQPVLSRSAQRCSPSVRVGYESSTPVLLQLA